MAKAKVTKGKPRVAIVYSHFPHYRKAIFDLMRSSEHYEYQFFYDFHGVDETIRSGEPDSKDVHVKTLRIGKLLYQREIVRLTKGFDALILLGNPFILSSWILAARARLLGQPVLLWTHGWLAKKSGLKEEIRLKFYRLAKTLLLYGDRAKEIGAEIGFDRKRMHVIYNSLDYSSHRTLRLKNELAAHDKRRTTSRVLVCREARSIT